MPAAGYAYALTDFSHFTLIIPNHLYKRGFTYLIDLQNAIAIQCRCAMPAARYTYEVESQQQLKSQLYRHAR
jgi:hypothetical protein